MGRALGIGRLFGIEIRIDASWVVVFVLAVVSLFSLFGIWEPGLGTGALAVVAVTAALLFFASVLFHELAHAFVARLYGIPVSDITLHMFGGVSNIEREPESPGAEFFIAIVGPLASVALGLGLSLASHALGEPATMLLAWLGPINVLIGIFNMLPGFPLDGGRVLRAVLWKLTGSLSSATRWAMAFGRLVGWTLIAVGAAMAIGIRIPVLGRGLGAGIWLVLVGAFLRGAAARPAPVTQRSPATS